MPDNATIATLPDSQGHNHSEDVQLNQPQCDSTKSNDTRPSTIEPSAVKHESVIAEQKHKVIFIGLPRTGTTSVSVALLEQGLKVAHMAFTKEAFMQADAISDAPCFSDFKQLDGLFPKAKFVYLDRELESWVPSMQMLLSRMLPHLDAQTGRFHPIMKRSFRHSFGVGVVENPQDAQHLIDCYLRHKQSVFDYFAGRDDFLSVDVSQQGVLGQLLAFIGLANAENQQNFPKLNVGRNVASWDEYKHPNKISANASGPEKRKFFDYKL
ncbi:sulfotransferase family protein [Shewanella seohaensis]|uniref:sulfotransferase family protein n=1 Tax=Shewanella seohaensis TaxID=755175 RepID=UPI00200E86C6|nr:sulfotransferase family protein [Shewanella seohaensis]MCL1122166.1 sulfotransferase family protein [Shewanella seohaensis]UXM82807.1 sulfotransferase family protein [Shewanella seohaensis]